MKAQLQWVWHVVGMGDTHFLKMVFFPKLATGAQNIGCPLKGFKDSLKVYLGLCGIPSLGWETLATHHLAWRKGIQGFEEQGLYDLDQKREALKERRPNPSTTVTCPQCGHICASNLGFVLTYSVADIFILGDELPRDTCNIYF